MTRRFPLDVEVLRNAVYFSTGIRAFRPLRILSELKGTPLEEFNLAALQFEAFQHYVTATEDLLMGALNW
jgi:hypothetical protein